MKLVYKRNNLAALSIDKYANAKDMRGEDGTNLPSNRVRDEAWARKIKIQADEIGATPDRELCVGDIRDSADFNADAHLAPPSISRSGTPGSGAAINVSPIKKARTPCASRRDNCSLRDRPLSETTVTSVGTRRIS